MELINRTRDLRAALYRSSMEEAQELPPLPPWGPEGMTDEEVDAQLAAAAPDESPAQFSLNALVAMKRYSMSEGGALQPVAADQALAEVGRDRPADDLFGLQLETDLYPRSGTDLVVVGYGYPHKRGGSTGEVVISAGEYRLAISLFGDRVWRREVGGLLPTRPEPFERLPLSWGCAFGGTADGGYGDLPCGDNPDGVGFYLSEGQAEGQSLPNIEDSGNLIVRWSDRPDPVGPNFYPMNWSLRLARYTEVDSSTGEVSIHPERGMFDFAHPRLSGKPLQAGDVVLLDGMTPEGRLSFEIPPCPAVADIQIGDRGGVRELVLEEVLVDVERRLVDLTWRKMFRYEVFAHELRTVSLRDAESGESR
jgi:hypothetical protein